LPHTSPIMKTSLELFRHAIEHYVSGSDSDYRIAVLHLSHSLELAVKTCLVNNNFSIFQKEGYTVPLRDGLKKLGEVWKVKGQDKIPYSARVELLVDERNAIQHRYGTIDPITMHYHMETAHEFMKEIFQKEYSLDIYDFIKENVSPEVLEHYPFVQQPTEDYFTSLRTLAQKEPTRAFLNACDILDLTVDLIIKNNFALTASFYNLSINEVLKTFFPKLDADALHMNEALSQLYLMRNKLIHKDYALTEQEAGAAIRFVETLVALIENNEPTFVETLNKLNKSKENNTVSNEQE